MPIDDYERVLVTSRQELRSWLEANAGQSQGIWLVTYKRASGKPFPTYDEIVEEGLCFGWIDSTNRPLNDEAGMMLFTPRRPKSTWSASNKLRLQRLIASGRMTERGLQAIEAAKANGSWDILDSVERLEVPDDLAAALDGSGVRPAWDAFPPGARKQMLWQVISAKRPATRAQRIDRIVSEAAAGRRAWG